MRNIRIMEQVSQLRVETYNTLNHTNLSGPNTNINRTSFGVISGNGEPRKMQIAAKSTSNPAAKAQPQLAAGSEPELRSSFARSRHLMCSSGQEHENEEGLHSRSVARDLGVLSASPNAAGSARPYTTDPSHSSLRSVTSLDAGWQSIRCRSSTRGLRSRNLPVHRLRS